MGSLVLSLKLCGKASVASSFSRVIRQGWEEQASLATAFFWAGLQEALVASDLLRLLAFGL